MTPEKELVKKDLDTYAALAAVAYSEGGQILMQNLAKDIMGSIDIMSSQAGIMQEQSLRAAATKIALSLQMYRALANADGNMRNAQDELDALLNS